MESSVSFVTMMTGWTKIIKRQGIEQLAAGESESECERGMQQSDGLHVHQDGGTADLMAQDTQVTDSLVLDFLLQPLPLILVKGPVVSFLFCAGDSDLTEDGRLGQVVAHGVAPLRAARPEEGERLCDVLINCRHGQ